MVASAQASLSNQGRGGLLRLHRFLQRRQIWYSLGPRPVAEPPPLPCEELTISTRYILCTSTKHLTALICNICPLKLHLYESFHLYPPFMVKGVPATQKAPSGSQGSPLHRECIRLGLHSLTAYSIVGAWTTQASTTLMSFPLQ